MTTGSARCPFYHLVPKDPAGNAAFRKRILKAIELNPRMRGVLWEMCRQDLLFFINAFCFTYNPKKDRPGQSKILPFITYAYQDDDLLAIDDAIGQHDLAVLKSREMGASWMVLVVFFWRWLFRSHCAFGALSRVKEFADKRDDKDALLPKIDLMLMYIPSWMRPGYIRNEGILVNTDNGSTITVDASTSNAFVGGRKTSVLMDEAARFPNSDQAFAAMEDVTSSRIAVSTPMGVHNGYHRFWSRCRHRIEMHWSKHPEKAVGLYSSKDGKLIRFDQKYQYPDDYRFILDEKKRSRWYDEECDRRTPQSVAENLDMEFLGSQDTFFDKDVIERHIARHCTAPTFVGELTYDPITCEPLDLVRTPGGRLRLWIPIDGEGRPPSDRDYAIAWDVSAGTGASSSAGSIGDCKERKMVGEYVTPYLKPHELASLAVALAILFRGSSNRTPGLARAPGEQPSGAYTAWEANGGPGKQFTDEILRRRYQNVFFRPKDNSISGELTDQPGWYTTKLNKVSMLGEYQRALSTDEFVNPCEESLRECLAYIHTGDGGIEHSASLDSENPSGGGGNHGDRCISAGLLHRIMTERGEVKAEKAHPSDSSFEGRRERRKHRKGSSGRSLCWSW